MVLLAFVACTEKKADENATEQTTKEVVVEEIEGYEQVVSTWFEKEVINDEDIQAINDKIQEMKEKISEKDITEETKTKLEELVKKLEDLKDKTAEKIQDLKDKAEEKVDGMK